MIEKTKEKDMTLKQRKWMKEYIKSGNASDAAMKVYNCKNRESAAQIGWENLKKLDYTEFMEECGVTDRMLQDKLTEGLSATKVVSAVITGKDADSRTNDFIDIEDYPTRHKYMETALKLKQRLVERKDITSGGKPLPQPILDALSNNDSNEKDKPVKEEN
jgi:hypothetical protein